MVHANPGSEDRGEGLILGAVGYEEGAVRPDFLEDPVELLGEDEVRRRPHANVARDRRDLRICALLDEIVIDGNRRQEGVHVRVLGVGEAELHGRGRVVGPPDERALDLRLDADVVIPVDAQHEGLHSTAFSWRSLYQFLFSVMEPQALSSIGGLLRFVRARWGSSGSPRRLPGSSRPCTRLPGPGRSSPS